MMLRLIAAFLALALSSPSWAASTFSVSCGSAAAGSDVSCNVTRTSGGKGVYVLFQTSDGTAKAGTDYTAVSQLLYFKSSAIAQTVAIHTFANPNATGTLTFTASIAASTLVVRTTGSIVEPVTTPVPTGSWVAAPLTIGGYAWLANQGPCCNGLIVKIVDGGMTNGADPALRQHWWAYVYYSDASGNFPATNPYWASAWMTGNGDSLQGVAPAP